MTNRVIVMVLDSFGIGDLPDAEKFGDTGSNTLGHIDQYCRDNGLQFKIPNLLKLGLGRAYQTVNGKSLHADNGDYPVHGFYGAARELSSGKDTTSGHWEIGGCPVMFDWGYFTSHDNSFPSELLDKIVKRAGIPGYLGNCHASGTTIIAELGEEHLKTGTPIFSTSADSVFQIASLNSLSCSAFNSLFSISWRSNIALSIRLPSYYRALITRLNWFLRLLFRVLIVP